MFFYSNKYLQLFVSLQKENKAKELDIEMITLLVNHCKYL